MEKQITFTEEEKSLIWSTKIAPANGTPDDALVFVNVCEEYGLNPLQGDIVFQRYETKYGPKVSYIVTRDGLLKHAHKQSNFISLNTGVVRENDHFKFDVKEEVVEHSFGAKRGKVIGAWTVLKTKIKGNIMVFADYEEYKGALGEKNNLWLKMPSAMIEKVAQSRAIRLAFPLGIDFRSEDEIIEYEMPTTVAEQKGLTEPSQNAENSNLTADLEKAKAEAKTIITKEPQKEVKSQNKRQSKAEKSVNEEISVEAEQNVTTPQNQPINPETTKSEQATVENQPAKEKTSPVENVQKELVKEEVVSEQANNNNAYIYVNSELKMSPSSGKKFLLVKATFNGKEEILHVPEQLIFDFDEFVPGVSFVAQIGEQMGFKFVQSVKVVDAA